MSRILVTGASGFVGRSLCRMLQERGRKVRAVVRRPEDAPEGTDPAVIGEIGPETEWWDALEDIDGVVHLAARTHRPGETGEEMLAAYRRINVAGTRQLALAAAKRGVRRLVFLSSVKVNGEETRPGKPFTEAHRPVPADPYGISKWEAEQALAEISRMSQLETVILRPPLIYGPGVKANFLALIRLCDRGLPLPFAAIANHRSLLFIGNLMMALYLCLDHPAAAGRTFLIKDGQDVSTPELVRQIARALHRPARLFPLPPSVLRTGAGLLGKGSAIRRLLDSLTVDDSLLRNVLDWAPPFTLAEGLNSTAAWYLGHPGAHPA